MEFGIREIVLVICLIIAVVLGYFGYKEMGKDNSSKYQQIEAKITNVRLKDHVTQTTTTVGKTAIIDRKTNYELWPQYQYTVGGQTYTGEYKLTTYSSMSNAQNEINDIMRLPARQKVNIFYEKANPSKSALQFAKNYSVAFFVGSVFAVILGLVAKFGSFSFGNPVDSKVKNVVIFNRELFR